MIRYAELLRAHSKIPKRPRKRSFFEISGYPHYENVCSNILGFFLNPGNEHGLKDLLLKSIGECIGQADLVFSLDGPVEVLREQQSLNGGRIDILIETPRHIIAIEHKIFHWLANDLDDYWKTIASRTKQPIGIVLALRKSQVKHPHFKPIEYADLISSVQRNLGQYVMEADRDYLYLLTSFFKTIQNLQGITMDELEFEFFANNFQATSDLVNAYSRFLAELDSTVQKLGGILFGGKAPDGVDQWFAGKLLVHDFIWNGRLFGMETVLKPNGWEISVFGRSKKRGGILNLSEIPERDFEFLGNQIQGFKRSSHRLIAELPLKSPMDDIVRRVEGVLSKVITSQKSSEASLPNDSEQVEVPAFGNPSSP